MYVVLAFIKYFLIIQKQKGSCGIKASSWCITAFSPSIGRLEDFYTCYGVIPETGSHSYYVHLKTPRKVRVGN
jgi:hypothetical protein